MVEYSVLPFKTLVPDIIDGRTGEELEVRAVGQVEESKLLLVWQSISSVQKENGQSVLNSKKTFVGISEIGSSDVKVVVQFQESIEIVYASLSQDHSLIAFVTETSNGDTNRKAWQAHVCKCSSQDSGDACLSVTDVHDAPVQLHFLPDVPSSEGLNVAQLQEKSLLVLIHKHSIQIHKLEFGDGGSIHQGSRGVLCLQFFWSQWFQHQHCLAFLHPWGALSARPLASKAIPNSSQELTISCIQFSPKGHYVTMFSISSYLVGPSQVPDTSCNGEFTLNKISPSKLNLEVILWREGNICICYQPFIEEPAAESSIPSERSDSTELPPEASALYRVTLLHHGSQIQAPRTNDWNSSSWPLTFAMIDDHQLLVLSVGGPAHILDTDPSHKTGFQIFLPESYLPTQLQGRVSVIPMPSKGSSALLCCLQTSTTGVSLRLNGQELVSLFCSTQVPTNRKNIAHYFATHVQDPSSINKLLMAISHDVWSLETKDLLSELLLGTTFASVKKSGISCHPILFQLPLSENNNNKECNWLKVEVLKPALDLDSLLKQSSHCGVDNVSGESCREIWHWLWHHQMAVNRRVITDPQSAGFKMDSLAQILEGVLNEDLPVEALTNESPTISRSPIGFADLCSLCVRNKPSGLSLPPDVSRVSSDACLPFPPLKADLMQRDRICSMVWSKLRSYLQLCCPLSSSSIINKICSDYILAQIQQCNNLCSQIFSIFGINANDNKGKFHFLSSLDSGRLQRLHSLLERFSVSCRSWAFPLPPGFNSVLTLTAYHSTHFLVFMQHVQLDAVKLEYESVLHLLQILDDGPENLKKKLHLISYLAKEEGEALLRQWSHPIGDKYRARRRARELLSAKDGTPNVQQVGEHDTEQSSAISMEAEFAEDAVEN